MQGSLCDTWGACVFYIKLILYVFFFHILVLPRNGILLKIWAFLVSWNTLSWSTFINRKTTITAGRTTSTGIVTTILTISSSRRRPPSWLGPPITTVCCRIDVSRGWIPIIGVAREISVPTTMATLGSTSIFEIFCILTTKCCFEGKKKTDNKKC